MKKVKFSSIIILIIIAIATFCTGALSASVLSVNINGELSILGVSTIVKDNLVYKVISSNSKTVSVSANTSNKPNGALEIPSTISIGNETFNVTAIASFASCAELTAITLPNTIQTISANSFSNCSMLSIVVINSQNVSNGIISADSMGGLIQNATEVYIKTTIVDAGKVGSYITSKFNSSQKITSGEYSGYTKYYFEEVEDHSSYFSYEYSGNEATITAYNGSGISPLYVPDTVNGYKVTAIADGGFYMNDNIDEVIIGNNITSIGSGAFDSSSIRKLTYGTSIKYIGDMAFNSVPQMEELNYLGTINDWVQIDFGYDDSIPTYSNTNCVIKINGSVVTDVVVDTATNISRLGFCNLRSLTSVTIGSQVESLSNNDGRYTTRMFSKCTSLSVIKLDSESIACIETGEYDLEWLDSISDDFQGFYVKTTIVDAGKVGSYITSKFNSSQKITSGEYSGYTRYYN